MRKSAYVLMLVAALSVVGQTASAKLPICCGTDGSCERASTWQCWEFGACPVGMVCDGTPGRFCGLAVAGCRLRNGDCIYANQACVEALRCTPDAACLMGEDPEGEGEEVTWCDADGPKEEVDTQCEHKNGVEAEAAE